MTEKRIHPGDDIQMAIGGVISKGGGTVILSPGTYVLPKPLIPDFLAKLGDEEE